MDECASDDALTIARNIRMRAALIWDRIEYKTLNEKSKVVESQYRIEDLQEHKFEEALSFVRAHCPKHEIMFQAVDFKNDEVSVKDFMNRCRSDMFGRVSIVAIDERTDRMVGVMINRILGDEDYAKTFVKACDQLVTGEAMTKIYRFHHHIEHKSHLYKHFPSSQFMKFRCIATRHRLPGVKRLKDYMIKATLKMAECLGVTAVSGVFTSRTDEALAQRMELEHLLNLYYLHYKTADGGVDFAAAKYPNFGAGVYGTTIPPKNEEIIYSME